MKRICLFLLLSLVCSGTLVHGQTAADEKVNRWRQDLTYLASGLSLRHPNPFLRTTKPLLQQKVVDLDAELPKLSDAAIVIGMAKIVALLGDSHTLLNLSQPGLDFHYFPLALTWLKDGYYVTGTTPSYQSLLGAKLMQINGMDAGAVEQLIAAVIPHENDSWLKERIPYYINAVEILETLGVLAQSQVGIFRFQNREGTVFTEELEPVSLAENIEWQTWPDFTIVSMPLYFKNRNRFYWYQYLPESQSLYFQYNSCREMPQPSFSKFSKELLIFIDKHPISRIIIDLRFNSGGNSVILDPLISELKKRPGINQPGRLFVLIGRGTFDAAVANAMRLRAETNAVLIGETTGGKPNYFGETKSFKLPNSGIEIVYATKYFSFNKSNMDALIPDVNVETTAEDYFQGIDPVVEKAMH